SVAVAGLQNPIVDVWGAIRRPGSGGPPACRGPGLASDGPGRLRQLARRTISAYVRMAATVVIAVVVRICLDCVGIILTGQEAEEAGFWFAHCRRDGRCVLAGIVLFIVSLTGCSVFAWSCQESGSPTPRETPTPQVFLRGCGGRGDLDPDLCSRGEDERDGGVVHGHSQGDNHRAAPVLSSSVAVLLTLSCALLTHLIMKHCNDVQSSAQDEKEGGWRGFGKFFLLTTLYCLGWAVGWSNWELVISLVDAFDMRGMAAVVIGKRCRAALQPHRYGPEPIIPDPRLQQLCYSHGYSNSLRRALVSYVVYSCVVFIVMCCCDPTYGILIILAREERTTRSPRFSTPGRWWCSARWLPW
ncbi:unnamed protein product, partial [Prorocentrum cordatum]